MRQLACPAFAALRNLRLPAAEVIAAVALSLAMLHSRALAARQLAAIGNRHGANSSPNSGMKPTMPQWAGCSLPTAVAP